MLRGALGWLYLHIYHDPSRVGHHDFPWISPFPRNKRQSWWLHSPRWSERHMEKQRTCISRGSKQACTSTAAASISWSCGLQRDKYEVALSWSLTYIRTLGPRNPLVNVNEDAYSYVTCSTASRLSWCEAATEQSNLWSSVYYPSGSPITSFWWLKDRSDVRWLNLLAWFVHRFKRRWLSLT